MTDSKRRGHAAECTGETTYRTVRGRFLPQAGEIIQLAAAAMLGESTVRRWYDRPERTSFGNRHRLRAAATRLNIRHPDPPSATVGGDEP